MLQNDFLIQFNKFANLHDGQKIIFSKTDYILQAFNDIKNLNNDVVLITGNSDYCIFYKNDSFVIKDLSENVLAVFKKEKIPYNLKYWFTVNNCTNIDFIKSLPMGIENDFHCKLIGHGHGWEHAKEKKEILLKNFSNKNFHLIDKNIYFNTSINTNYKIRHSMKEFCLNNNIYVETEQLSFINFFQKSQQFRAILCPLGNGFDTHRFYETLLMNRVPIIIRYNDYKIYDDIYKLFPCIILEKIDDILTESIQKKIDIILNKNLNEFNNFEYWRNFILKHINF